MTVQTWSLKPINELWRKSARIQASYQKRKRDIHIKHLNDMYINIYSSSMKALMEIIDNVAEEK